MGPLVFPPFLALLLDAMGWDGFEIAAYLSGELNKRGWREQNSLFIWRSLSSQLSAVSQSVSQ